MHYKNVNIYVKSLVPTNENENVVLFFARTERALSPGASIIYKYLVLIVAT